jgi:hypothetical protein
MGPLHHPERGREDTGLLPTMVVPRDNHGPKDRRVTGFEYLFAGLEHGNRWKGQADWDGLDALFNELGSTGWEFVGRVDLPIGRDMTFRYAFKRPSGRGTAEDCGQVEPAR